MCTNMGKGRSGKSDTGSLKNGFNGKWFGVSVLNNGGKRKDYYFKQEKSGVLMKVGLAAAPKKTTVTPQEFVKNAKERSRSVDIISPKETNRRIDERNRERSNKPDYEFGTGTPWGNKDGRKAARDSRLSGRTLKRKR